MYLDKQNLFSEDQEVTTTCNSTNVIDLGVDGTGVVSPNEKNVNLFAQVTEDFATLTSVKIQVHTDASTAFGTNTKLFETGVIARAALVAGYKFALSKLPNTGVLRYLRITFTTVGSTGSAGKIKAGAIINEQTNR